MQADRPLVIVGAGTAGHAAAIEAARAGLRPTLIDDGPAPPSSGDRLEVWGGTSALLVAEGPAVLWARGDASGLVRAGQLILATGTIDRPVPFPGWDLPGVVAVRDLESERRPARRALVAGTGRPILAAARRLVEEGVEVVAVLDAGDADGWAGEPTHGAGPDLEFLGRAGVSVRSHHTVFAAIGRDGVEGATFGPVAPDDWRPLRGRAETVALDRIVTGFGRLARNELASLAGCRQRFEPGVGGWVTARDEFLETTVPGIFAVGEGAGVAGPLVAGDEGRIAGITAAERAGLLGPAEAEARRAGPRTRLAAIGPFRAALDAAAAPRPGLLELAVEATCLCRCEGVTLARVREAIAGGADDLASLKLATRLGMGRCQGRGCEAPAALAVARATGRGAGDVGRINPRPPARPVTLGALARMEGVE